MNKPEKNYCLWDSNYGDFLENFETLAKAKKHALNYIRKNPEFYHEFTIGKWCNMETVEYKKLVSIFYNKFTKKIDIKKY